MIAFFIKCLFSGLLIFLGFIFNSKKEEHDNAAAFSRLAFLLAALIGLIAIVQTSFIYVPADKFAIFTHSFPGKALAPGRKVAFDGEIGPQAKVWTSGPYFSLGLTLFNDIEYVPITVIPTGKCGVLFAKDGAMPKDGAAFASVWSESEYLRMINDAEYFLKSKEEGGGAGVRGPQATVLFPGPYTINPHLWEAVTLIDATVIEQGTAGAVKAFVSGDVNFGPFKRTKSTDGKLKILTAEKLPKGAMQPTLVPVGDIGVWEEALPNGIYYINTFAYYITKCPTIQFRLNYAGGYTKRIADLNPDEKGNVTTTITSVVVPAITGAADSAIPVKLEGFDAVMEARALVQIQPLYVPFVVAGLGLPQNATLEETSLMIEDKVITPVLRSVSRNIVGGAQLTFTSKELILENGTPKIDSAGELITQTKTELRTPKVLDLIENREILETAIEEKAQAEALKEGIHITEFRLAEAVIPAEISAARKRELLAAQHVKAYIAEKLSQEQRMNTENAKAQAEQQGKLVEAQIEKEASIMKKEARLTEAEGEKGYLLAVAEAQKAQTEILGPEQTVKLQMFERTLKTIATFVEQNPQVLVEALKSSGRMVPSIVVNSGPSGGDNNAASLLFGSMLNPSAINTLEKAQEATKPLSEKSNSGIQLPSSGGE